MTENLLALKSIKVLLLVAVTLTMPIVAQVLGKQGREIVLKDFLTHKIK